MIENRFIPTDRVLTPKAAEIERGAKPRFLKLEFKDAKLTQAPHAQATQTIIEGLNFAKRWALYRSNVPLLPEATPQNQQDIHAFLTANGSLMGETQSVIHMTHLITRFARIANAATVDIIHDVADFTWGSIKDLPHIEEKIERDQKSGIPREDTQEMLTGRIKNDSEWFSYIINHYRFALFVKSLGNIAIPSSYYTQGGKPIVLYVENKASLGEFLTDTLQPFIHDFKTPLTALSLTAQSLELKARLVDFRIYQERRQQILEQFLKINEEIERLANKWKESTVSNFREIFASFIAPQLQQAGFRQEDVDLVVNPRVALRRLLRIDLGTIASLVREVGRNSLKKYTANAQPTRRNFQITVRNSDDESGVTVWCNDNGGGYPPEIVHRGFIQAAKEKIHGYGSDDVESNGMGMAMYTGILNKHEGDVIPQNTETGAQTVIFIPFAKNPKEDVKQETVIFPI